MSIEFILSKIQTELERRIKDNINDTGMLLSINTETLIQYGIYLELTAHNEREDSCRPVVEL